MPHCCRAGVVLHFTSLPGPHGSGDLGASARRFVEWLASAGQSVWQVLPVGPIGPGDSPYQSVSAFAGSPLLVALGLIVKKLGFELPDTIGPIAWALIIGGFWSRANDQFSDRYRRKAVPASSACSPRHGTARC